MILQTFHYSDPSKIDTQTLFLFFPFFPSLRIKSKSFIILKNVFVYSCTTEYINLIFLTLKTHCSNGRVLITRPDQPPAIIRFLVVQDALLLSTSLSCWSTVVSPCLMVTLFSYLSIFLSAATCEFLDIVELLLQSGADPTLRDQDGCLPEEVTGCKAVSLVLQQHMAGKA